jgi:multidrug transporter EmrE-like cation transporter
MSLVNFFLILTGVIFNAFAQLALKAGAEKIGYLDANSNIISSLKLAINLPIFIGLLCYAISVGVWVVALSRVQVSIAYPILSLGYIVVSILAYFYFNEPLSTHKFISMLVIIFGVYLLSRS